MNRSPSLQLQALSLSLVPEPPSHCSSFLSLSGSGVYCQITPRSSIHEEAPPREELHHEELLSHVSVCHSASTRCCWGERVEAVQDPCSMLHLTIASQGLVPGKACILSSDPASQNWLLITRGLSSEPPQHLPHSPMLGKARKKLLPSFFLKILSQDPMCSESQWEKPLFQLMRATVSHICLCPSSE